MTLTSALAVLALAPVPAGAHEFWIAPASYRPPVGSHVAVHLRVGEHFQGEEYPRDPTHLRRFVHLAGPGPRPVQGRTYATPAGSVRVREPGLQLLGYGSAPSRIVLPADRFNAYLLAEGLLAAARLRAHLGERDLPGREAFARCAKSLLSVGPASATDRLYRRRLGLELELVPEKNPYRLAPGEALPVRLYLRGRVLAGARVAARSKSAPGRVVVRRTDRQGRVRLPLAHPGEWLVTSLHLSRTRSDPMVDWRSLWASLTFEVPARR